MNINECNLKKIMRASLGNKPYTKSELFEFAGIIKAATDFLEDEIMRILYNDKIFWQTQRENYPRRLEPKIRIDQTTKLMDVVTHCTYSKEKK